MSITRPTRHGFARQVANRIVLVGILVFLLWWWGRVSDLNLNLPVVVFLGVLVVAISLVFTGNLWPEPSSADWDVRLDVEVPQLPQERGALRLADTVRGAGPRARFTMTELRDQLRDLAAGRLVRHHDADPADPFATASGLLSPGLLRYLTAPGTPPPLRRSTVGHYLKEIRAL